MNIIFTRPLIDSEDLMMNFFKSGHINYIDFPRALERQYQAFTEADLTNLRNAGYKGMSTELEDGIKSYLSFLSEV